MTNTLNDKSKKINAQQSSNGASATKAFVVQVHNGSLQDIISPPQNKSSDAQPINILLGSCTRFSNQPISNKREATELPTA